MNAIEILHEIKYLLIYLEVCIKSFKGNDQELLNFINSWIEIGIKGHYLDEIYNHWILGKGAQEKKPRWSVIRDVLKWVE